MSDESSVDGATVLLGSNKQPDEIEIGNELVPLGDVVYRAYEATGMTVGAWNDLPDEDREARIAATIAAMNIEMANRDAPEEQPSGGPIPAGPEPVAPKPGILGRLGQAFRNSEATNPAETESGPGEMETEGQPVAHGFGPGAAVAFTFADGERTLNGRRRWPATVAKVHDDNETADLIVHHGAPFGDGPRERVPYASYRGEPGCFYHEDDPFLPDSEDEAMAQEAMVEGDNR